MPSSLTLRFGHSALLASALMLLTPALPAFAQDGAKSDMHAAGHDTKDAAVDTGHATKRVAHKTAHGTRVAARKTKNGTETVGHDVAHGTSVAAHDTAHGAKVAAHDTAHETRKLGDKIAGKPAPPNN